MKFLYNEYSSIRSNIDEFFQNRKWDNKLPRQQSKMKDFLRDIVLLVYGEESIIDEFLLKGAKGYSIIVSFELEKPFVGINQTSSVEPRVKTYISQLTIRHFSDESEWELFQTHGIEGEFEPWDGKVLEYEDIV